MTILITGANGFLGHYLTEKLLRIGHPVIATGKGPCRLNLHHYDHFLYTELNFTDSVSVYEVLSEYRPAVIVHAGAMTKPDDCELHQWEAHLTNTEATITLLMQACEYRSFFVFLSTDFIFDGEKGMYSEDDKPGPVNFYGQTKLEAEVAVKGYEYDWSIVRTVLVYGKPLAGRSNILTVVKEKLEKGETYNVVDDQVRTPTYVEDLAEGIVSVIEKRATGTWHLSGEDMMTPYQMACATADYLSLDSSLIRRVTASNFSQPARRPLKTGFTIDKARQFLGFRPIPFREGLAKTFAPS